MRDYAIRRILAALLVISIASVIIFTMMHLLPGDALLTKLGDTGRIPPDQMNAIRAKMGIDQPLYSQYLHWVGHVFDGSMGQSLIFDGQTVSHRLIGALPITVELGTLGMAIAIAVGIPLGVISAMLPESWLDYVLRMFALLGLSIPSFWLGLVIIIYGTLYLGYVPPREFVGFLTDPFANLREMWIPAVVLGFSLAASIMRMSRSTVLEALHEDYARTARAKGLATHTVVIRHVLRNSLIPVVTLVGNQAAFVFSGALIIEVLFGLPGLGQLTYTAILQRDYTQVQGDALVVGAIVVFINLLVDLSYGLIDPRIRYS